MATKNVSTATDDDGPDAYRDATLNLDCRHPSVVAFTKSHLGEAQDDLARAVNLYYGVRDGIRYDPYLIRTRAENYRASYVVEHGAGFCIQKAAVYAASCRCAGIPARPGYADVRNHIASRRLRDLLGTDLFVYHGYVEVYLNGRWVKATPAFNLDLCQRFHILPLEFNGRENSLHHAYDAKGRKYMEYVRDHGTRKDVPAEEIIAVMLEAYPNYFQQIQQLDTDFSTEAPHERAQRD